MASRATRPQRGARRRVVQSEARGASGFALWLNRVVVGSACVAVLAVAARAGLYLVDLRVERIAVSGVLAHIDRADIERQVAGELDQGFLLADLDRIQERLEQMPWVHVAQVRRHWPDTIGIQVKEQQPIARWGDNGFLNHEGDFFPGAQGAASEALPLLEGDLARSQALMQRYLRLEQVLTPMGIEVAHLSMDTLGQLEITFRSGPTLLLGNRDFAQRLQRFARLWRDAVDPDSVISIDMRYEYGAAVREREVTAVAAAVTTIGGMD